MKLIILLLVSATLASCEIESPHNISMEESSSYAFDSSDEYFDDIKIQFEDDYYNNKGVSIDASWIRINFSDDANGTVAATCYTWTSGKREIVVNSNHWDTLTEAQQEQLIYHELGHCVLNLGHDSSFINNTPISIMHPNILTDYDYTTFRDYYLNELFNK